MTLDKNFNSMNDDEKFKEKEVHLNEKNDPTSEVEITEGSNKSSITAYGSDPDLLKKKSSILRMSIFILLFSLSVGLFTRWPSGTDNSVLNFVVYFVEVVNISIFFELLYTNIFYRSRAAQIIFSVVIFEFILQMVFILIPITRAISFLLVKNVQSNKLFKCLVWLAVALSIALVIL